MNTVSYLGIVLLLLLILPTFYVNYKLGSKKNKKIVISILRMIIQLLLVAFYLQYIFNFNNFIINILYVFVMIMVASISTYRSANFNEKKAFFSIFIPMLILNIGIVLFFNYFVINLDSILDARYFIPMTGIILGNIMKGNILGLMNFYSSIRSNKEIINYDLLLGATKYEALKPYLLESINKTIQPTIAMMATVGIVTLPGVMTGQILSGVVPIQAILYQIAIMLATYSTRYFNTITVIYFTSKVMFDENDNLIENNFKNKQKKHKKN